MKKFANLIFVFTIGTLTILSGSGLAQERPCSGDIDTFCKEIPQGEGAIINCLSKNKEKLSKACLEHQKWMKENFKEHRKENKEQRQEKKSEIMAKCGADFAKFCQEESSEPGRPIKCLIRHRDAVSAACKEVLPERPNLRLMNKEKPSKKQEKDDKSK